MKAMDPSIETVVCGSSNEHMPEFGAWETAVLQECYENVDYISMHQYYDAPEQGTMHHIAKALRMDKFIDSVVALADAAKATHKSDKTLNISFDEWNVWYHSNEADEHNEPWQQAPHLLEDVYDFQDALLVGSSLITLLKHVDRVKIACFAQLVNVIAPILTDKTGLIKQTIFTPLADVSKYGYGETLLTHVKSDTYHVTEFGDVPYLDAVIVKNDVNQYTVFAVNRHQTESLTLDIGVNAGEKLVNISHRNYTCDDPHLTNTKEQVVPITMKEDLQEERYHHFRGTLFVFRPLV